MLPQRLSSNKELARSRGQAAVSVRILQRESSIMIHRRIPLFLVLLPMLLCPGIAPMLHAQEVKTITIHAKKYQFMPSEITVKKGQTVKLILISDDVAHGLAVKGLGIRADIPKGKKPVEVTVTPEKTGDFKGECSKFCGMGHGSMHFMVHVVD